MHCAAKAFAFIKTLSNELNKSTSRNKRRRKFKELSKEIEIHLETCLGRKLLRSHFNSQH
jgi:hypothetical protein